MQSDPSLLRKAAIFRARAGGARDVRAAQMLNELADAFEAEAAKEALLEQSAANDPAAPVRLQMGGSKSVSVTASGSSPRTGGD